MGNGLSLAISWQSNSCSLNSLGIFQRNNSRGVKSTQKPPKKHFARGANWVPLRHFTPQFEKGWPEPISGLIFVSKNSKRMKRNVFTRYENYRVKSYQQVQKVIISSINPLYLFPPSLSILEDSSCAQFVFNHWWTTVRWQMWQFSAAVWENIQQKSQHLLQSSSPSQTLYNCPPLMI